MYLEMHEKNEERKGKKIDSLYRIYDSIRAFDCCCRQREGQKKCMPKKTTIQCVRQRQKLIDEQNQYVIHVYIRNEKE